MPTITLYDADGNPIEVEEPEAPNVRQMREKIKELQAEADRAAELQKQLDSRDRQAALAAAGLQLDDTRMKALEAVHPGEWTAAAVKDTAVKLGWMQPEEQLPPDEADALARLNAAQQGATTTPPNPDADFDARLAQCKTEREVIELYRQSGRPMTT